MTTSTKTTSVPESFSSLFGEGGWPWPPPTPVATAAGPKFQTASYIFSVNHVSITNTRARHEDSDKAAVTVAVGTGEPHTMAKDLGDRNNGDFAVDLSVGPVVISDPNSGVAFNYLIVNSGHDDWKTIDGVLTQAGGTLAKAGAQAATSAIGGAVGATIGSGVMPIIGTILGAAAGWLVGEVTGILTANCDGPVASEQPAFKGADLWNRTQVPGNILTHTTYHPGLDSSVGCGSNSQYYVTWQIRRLIDMTVNVDGAWTDGSGRNALISVSPEDTITVNMSAFGRPVASGAVLSPSTISVTFPDDRTYIGTIETPNRIRWSNGSSWTRAA